MPKNDHTNISTLRAAQIIRMWETLNYSDDNDGTERDTLIDIFADIYHYCQQKKISWTDVVSNAEKWGLAESSASKDVPPAEGWEQRMLAAIFNADPLAVNDPDEEEGCGKWGCKDCYPDEGDE